MTVLDQTIVNIALPRLENAFGADLNAVQWVLTAYILTQGVATPTTAFFVDRLGARRFYIAALTIFTIGSALCGIAWNLPILVFFRVLQGIGGAFLFPVAITLVYREFPPQERGLASGVLGIAALLAPAVGPTLGGYFVTYLDWQLIFFINIPFGILGIILAATLLREIRTDTRTAFDFPGFILVALGLSAVLYGLSDASTDGWGSPKILGSLFGGLLILMIFVFAETMRSRQGKGVLVDLSIFANGPFLTSNITNALATFAFFGGLFIFPISLQNLRSLNAFQAGILLLPQAIASMVTAILGGRLVDRFGPKVIIIPGMILLVISGWLLTFLTLDTPFWSLQIVYILRGLALGCIIQPLTVAALSDIRPEKFAQASSLNTVVRFVSTSLGIAILATLVQTRVKIHTAHLAERVTALSPLGQQITHLQALFLSRGANPTQARIASLQTVYRLVTRQGYMLSFVDAFWLTLAILIIGIISSLLIRDARRTKKTTLEKSAFSDKEKEERAEIPVVAEF